MALFTTEDEFKERYGTIVKTFASGRTKSLAWRKWQLKQLCWLLDDNEDEIVEALFSYLHCHPFETFAMELCGMDGHVIENLENVEIWVNGDAPDAGFFMDSRKSKVDGGTVHKSNHIFYTGSTTVTRLVARAASKYFTPVVLELEGQAPTIVFKSTDIDIAARRLAYAKLLKLGQVCLNVNHVFLDPEIHDKLVERLIHWNDVFLCKGSDDISRIINERTFDRITRLLKKSSGEVVHGGDSDRMQKTIKPTNREEHLHERFPTFRGIVRSNRTQHQGRHRVCRLHHQLNAAPARALRLSRNQSEFDHVIESTTSGRVTVKDIMIHAGVPNASFRGVGESGYGSYHGKYGFDAFSRTRTFVPPPSWMESPMSFRYAPYDMNHRKYFDFKNKLGFKKGDTMED